MIQFIIIIFLFLRFLSFNSSVMSFKIMQMRILNLIEKQNKYKMVSICLIILFLLATSLKQTIQNFFIKQIIYESVEIMFIPKITLHACNGKDINYFMTFMFCAMCYSLIVTSPINWIFSSIMILEFFLPKILPLHVIKQNESKELKMKILNENKILLISQMRTLQIYCTYKNSFEQKISIFPYYVRKIKYFANKDLLILICDDQRFKISLLYLTVKHLKILKIQDINDINYQSRIKVLNENHLVYSYQDSIYNYNLRNSQSQRLFQCSKIIFYKIYNNDNIIVLSQKGKPYSPIDIHFLGSKYCFCTSQFKDKLLNHLIVDKHSLQNLLIQHQKKNMAFKLQQNPENDKFLVLCFQKITQIINLNDINDIISLKNGKSCSVIKNITNQLIIYKMSNYYYFYSEKLNFQKYYHFFNFAQIKSIKHPNKTINSQVYGIIKDYKSYRFVKLQLYNV
ncbi:transmembrane protein, putative (macronuclear) [Tetrahymena thermophila SB210]|uniref:Transmembrane protein, putative n=1 Tax=Tetrahymena thermophila (strain SB210) TaxID=312017 RepID=W7X8B0_TETTS|nr:transmembrane protein, putative [Tetrahymena thermophila SB210]EWS73587.1 transmembrane protein, putative [Tetrahymena thermophila SB210]|eukprot:XP_012653883.1 transmembrane protein, putative [Tetrahymena thermophila SB210]